MLDLINSLKKNKIKLAVSWKNILKLISGFSLRLKPEVAADDFYSSELQKTEEIINILNQ